MPDSAPVVPLFDSVIVRVSVTVAPAFVSPIVTPVNGLTAASNVVCVACVPAIVGATAASVSVTVVALSLAAVA